MKKDDEQSKLVWILRQLITSETKKKRPLDRGLKLSWHPADENGECELWAGRLESQPSEQEDRILLASLAAAAKLERLILADMRMSPGQTIRAKRNYGATVFRFRLATQPPLIEV